MSVADILERAADLIEPEGAWTKNEMARGKSGASVNPDGKYAICWCVMGAVYRAAGNSKMHYYAALNRLSENIGKMPVWQWNDDPDRTKPEILSQLREAARKARGETAEGIEG